jgi:hypothetical protein
MALWQPCYSCKTLKEKLVGCSGCEYTIYCDKKCQASDWKNHKVRCEALSVIKKTIKLYVKICKNESCQKHSDDKISCVCCERISYCSADCAIADWQKHRTRCFRYVEKAHANHVQRYGPEDSIVIECGKRIAEERRWRSNIEAIWLENGETELDVYEDMRIFANFRGDLERIFQERKSCETKEEKKGEGKETPTPPATT